MSLDHYRDMYSARREDVLEPGLTSVFDEALKTDEDLREDYSAFCAACDGLDLGAKESIEAPEWLSARILDRLEAVPSSGGLRAPWFSLRSLGFAALAGVAIAGAGFAVLRGSDGSVAKADVGLGSGEVPPSAGDVLRPVVENGKVFVDFQAVGPHDVGIFAGPDGALLKRFRVSDARLHSELANTQPDPFAFEVRVDRQERPLLVVVPGTDRSRSAASGSGTLVAFAQALARTYGTPIALRVASPKTAVTWNMTGPQAQTEAHNAVDDLGLSVDVMPGGLLSIQDR